MFLFCSCFYLFFISFGYVLLKNKIKKKIEAGERVALKVQNVVLRLLKVVKVSRLLHVGVDWNYL